TSGPPAVEEPESHDAAPPGLVDFLRALFPMAGPWATRCRPLRGLPVTAGAEWTPPVSSRRYFKPRPSEALNIVFPQPLKPRPDTKHPGLSEQHWASAAMPETPSLDCAAQLNASPGRKCTPTPTAPATKKFTSLFDRPEGFSME